MKSSKRILAVIMIASFICTSPAYGGGEELIIAMFDKNIPLKRRCAGLFLVTGMLSGLIGGGTASSSSLEHTRGFFESSSAYHQRIERNRERAAPYLYYFVTAMGSGLFLVGYDIATSFFTKRIKENPARKSGFHNIKIINIPDESTVSVNGKAFEVIDNAVELEEIQAVANHGVVEIKVLITNKNGSEKVYALNLKLNKNTDVTIPIDALEPSE